MDEHQKRMAMVLVGILVVAGGVFGIKHWYANRRHPVWDGERIKLLEQVIEAQRKFRAHDLDNDEKPNYATHQQLVRLKLVPASHSHSYIEIVPSTADRTKGWYALIGPLHPSQGWAYFTNHTGKIYTCQLRPRVDDKSCEVPAQMQQYEPE